MTDFKALSEADWKQRLSEEQFQVARRHGTERPFSSPLNDNKAAGRYACAGCGQVLFSSEDKYDSGLGLAVLHPAHRRGGRGRDH